jgi:hypothetical protein
MRTRRGKSRRTGTPHNRPSRLEWRLTCDLPRLGRCVVWFRSSLPLRQSSSFHRSTGGTGLAWAVGALEDLQAEKQLSWIAHLASYAVALAALLSCMAGSAAAGWSSGSAVLLAGTLLFVLAAQVLAGVQFLRPSGPPGTLPAHIRRLNKRSRYRNE